MFLFVVTWTFDLYPKNKNEFCGGRQTAPVNCWTSTIFPCSALHELASWCTLCTKYCILFYKLCGYAVKPMVHGYHGSVFMWVSRSVGHQWPVTHSLHCQCFRMGRTTPQNWLFPWECTLRGRNCCSTFDMLFALFGKCFGNTVRVLYCCWFGREKLSASPTIPRRLVSFLRRNSSDSICRFSVRKIYRLVINARYFDLQV